MDNGQELFRERDELKEDMKTSLKNAYDSGKDMAEKTRIFRMKSAETILRLKAEGVQISIIDKVARGDKEVANAEFEMIVSEVSYKAANERINVLKKMFESVEADIKREVYTGQKE